MKVHVNIVKLPEMSHFIPSSVKLKDSLPVTSSPGRKLKLHTSVFFLVPMWTVLPIFQHERQLFGKRTFPFSLQCFGSFPASRYPPDTPTWRNGQNEETITWKHVTLLNWHFYLSSVCDSTNPQQSEIQALFEVFSNNISQFYKRKDFKDEHSFVCLAHAHPQLGLVLCYTHILTTWN